MKSVRLLLNTTDSVKSFVNLISSYDYDADIRSGRYVVDAKSILGIFSLDLNRPVVLEVYDDNCDELLSKLSPYMQK
ncbi:MAG: HPr family phosphocarrier protein [Clostridia bacterium]|nr:HPr family phosphocarrier protein [Clostridia bacterium]